MKKIYYLLALVVAVVLGVSISRAYIIEFADDVMAADAVENGSTFVIGMNITNGNGSINADGDAYNHNFGSTDKVMKDNGESETLAYQENVATANYVQNMVWEVELVSTDAVGSWFRVKNSETGRYMGYTVKDGVDPSDLDALAGEDEDEDAQWWKEGNLANCLIQIEMVDEANAKLFTFQKPSVGFALIAGAEAQPEDKVASLIEAVDDDHVMVMTRFELAGKAWYAACNSAYNGHLSRYTDWAAYYRLLKTNVKDDPYTELGNKFNEMQRSVLVNGNPGSMVDVENAKIYNAKMDEIALALETPDQLTNEVCRGYLEDLADIKAFADTAEIVPVTAGYYRIYSAYPEYEKQQEVRKALSSNGQNVTWGTFSSRNSEDTEDSIHISMIWKVEANDTLLYLYNLGAAKYAHAAAQSTAWTVSATPEAMRFVSLGKAGDFNIFGATTFPAHTGGHGGGAGVSGNVVGWAGGSGTASSWAFEPVDPSELESIQEVVDQIKLNVDLATLLSESQALVEHANDVSMVCDYGTEMLIKSTDQIYSEAGDPSDGANIGVLIDNSTATFWHSNWHTEGAEGKPAPSGVDHIVYLDLGKAVTQFGLYYIDRCDGTNKESSPVNLKVGYCNEYKGDVTWNEEVYPVSIAGVTEPSYNAIVLPEASQYIAVSRAAASSKGNNFWSASELNAVDLLAYEEGYDYFAKANTQGNNCGDALVDAIAAAGEIEVATADDIATLQAAYDAFAAVYTDPDLMKAAVAAINAEVKAANPGSGPGQKPQADYDALKAAADAAKAFNDNQMKTCTKAEMDAAIAAAEQAIEVWRAVETGTIDFNAWYYITCPDAVFSALGYNPSDNGFGTTTTLLGARLSAGKGDATEVANLADGDNMYMVPKAVYTGEMKPVNADGEELAYSYNDASSQWRFVPYADGYAVQNRATGNFLPAPGKNGAGMMKASLVPGVYNMVEYDYGVYNLQSVIDAEGTISCAHMRTAGGVLVSWQTTGAQSVKNGSSWIFEKADDIQEGYEQTINMRADSFKLKGVVLPYSVNVPTSDDCAIYTSVLAVDMNQEMQVSVAQEFNVVEAGTPMLITAPELAESIVFQASMVSSSQKLSRTVDNSGALKGTLTGDSIVAGSALPGVSGDWGAFLVNKKQKYVAPGDVWLSSRGAQEVGADAYNDGDNQYPIITESSVNFGDGVAAVKAAKAAGKPIYTIDGQAVSKPTQGLYIIDGKKVVVK